ncbi:hypothetical protein ACFO3K_13305 [Cellulomonas algicola]|uniref:hypothetical protein n=1 Tax=Cellulomonas algicola TaxID=2071633 RepID=UPI001C3FDCEE|nr:hypothetical protein [Cellulomonas algicola]
MAPVVDVHVWVAPENRADALRRFLADHVDVERPGDDRLAAVERTYVHGAPLPGDRALLADLARTPQDTGAFTIYVRAREHHGANVTVTREGAPVVGLAIDDPLESRVAVAEAVVLAAQLEAAVGGTATLLGAEVLPPPQDRDEWRDAEAVLHRSGSIETSGTD